jgi:beta-phosphoglucomutase
MNQVKGVIFDMDGVVVDNHRFHFKAWMEFAQKYKFPLDTQIYRDKFNGKTNADLFTMIFGDITPAQIKSYADEKEGLYKELYASEMKTHKGLIDFLDYLSKKKIKVALGTSAPPENVDFTLDGLTIRKYFPVIVDGSMVSKGKPDPQVYQLCCSRLGLDPKNCVVFEDALLGLEAGERAGCKIVAVATSHEVYELKSKTENIIFDFTEARKFIE